MEALGFDIDERQRTLQLPITKEELAAVPPTVFAKYLELPTELQELV